MATLHLLEELPENIFLIPEVAPKEINMLAIENLFKRIESLLLLLHLEVQAGDGTDLAADQIIDLYDQGLYDVRDGSVVNTVTSNLRLLNEQLNGLLQGMSDDVLKTPLSALDNVLKEVSA